MKLTVATVTSVSACTVRSCYVLDVLHSVLQSDVYLLQQIVDSMYTADLQLQLASCLCRGFCVPMLCMTQKWGTAKA